MEKTNKLTTKKLIIILATLFVVVLAAIGVVAYLRGNVKQVASQEDYGYINPDETKAEPDAGITIDGVLDEKEYQDNNWLYLRNDNGNATVDIATTSYYGEKGMYFVYDVTESTPIYVNLSRSSALNSCVELYLALSDVTSMDSSEIFEIDLLPTGDMVFKQRNGKGAFMDVATTDDKMAYLGTTTKGGEINTEECYGYCLEFFIPWDYLEFLGLDVETMKTDYVFVNTAHITSYNYAGTAETDRYWYSFAQQLGGNGWGNVSLYYRFNADGVIGAVPVQLKQGDHYTMTGAKTVIPGVKTHVTISPEEGYALSSILVNGEEYIKQAAYNEDGSVSLNVRGVKEGLEISASAELVTEGNKTLNGTVKVHNVNGDSLKGITAGYMGPDGEKPLTLDSKGNFTLPNLKQGYYTITIEKTGYEKIERGIYVNRDIDAEFVLEYTVFEVESGRCWQLEEVNDGVINKMGGFGSLLTTDSYKKFSIEANFKYYEDVAESLDEQDRLEQRQGIRIKFSNDKYWHIDLLYQNERYFIQYAKATTDSIFNFRDIYVLSEEEVAQFKSEDGIQLKVVRDGNRAIIYLGGNLVAVEDLDKEYTSLTAKVGFESWGPFTDVRTMEYKISTDVNVDVDTLYFGYHKNWDVTKQFEGVVSQPNGGNTVWLRFFEKLTDMDFTFRVKDNPLVDGEAPRTSIRFEFDNGETFIASICENANGVVQIQKFPCTYTDNKWAGSYYNFTEAEKAQYKTEEGLDFRVVRVGTEILFFINGEYKTSVDLSELIEADTPAIVSVQHVDDVGVPYEMPFTLNEKVEKVIITQKESSGKSLKTEKGTTVIVSAEDGYYIKALSLNGKDVSEGLAWDGTYVYVADKANYTLKATLAKRIFETDYGWDLLEQNQGTKDGVTTGVVSLPNGGTSSSNLTFIEKYADMDLTWRVKDHPDSDATNTTAPRTSFEFIFDEVLTGENKTFTLSVSDSNLGVVQIQNTSGLRDKTWTSYYNFDDDETAKYRSADGVDIRIVRDGTDFILFVDGELKAVIDLSEYIKADTKATVRINHNDDNGVEIEMPYAVTDQVDIGKIYFGYHIRWDVTNQFDGSVTQPNGGNTVWLRFFEKIASMDLNIKVLDNPKVSGEAPRTSIRFEFDNGETFLASIGESNRGIVQLQNLKSTTNEKDYATYFNFTEEEQAQYKTEEGIDFRVIRNGTEILFFVGGEYKMSVDLSEFIEADTPAIVSIQHQGDQGVAYEMPFTMSEKVQDVTVAKKESTGKSLKTEKGTTVVVSAEEGYYIKALSLNGKDVSKGLSWKGTYVFVAEKANYTIKATLAKRIFDTKYGWDLLGQNQGTKDGVTTGTVTLPNGGTTSNNLTFIEKYADMDLTWRVKDHPDSDAASTTAPRTSFEFIFDEVLTGENKMFTLSVSDSNKGVVQIQNTSGLRDKAYTSYYNFDDDETAKYRSADGVDIRIVRDGTDFILFVDGELKAVVDLSEYIKADTKATVRVNHNDDDGVAIEMPYAVTDQVDIGKIYFGYHLRWDVTNQFEGSVTQPNGGNTVWLRFFDKIATMDLNIKVLDNPNVDGDAPRTSIRFEFDNGETFLASISESNRGVVQLQNLKSTTNEKDYSAYYNFSDDEQAQYMTEEGIDFRVVRNGTDILFFIGGEYKTCVDLSEFIEADTPAIVSIQHQGDQGVAYEMPFTLAEELDLVTITTETNNGKELVTDKASYVVGQEVNVEAEEGYYIKAITVNGVDDSANLDLDGTYTFTATEKEYKLVATVKESVFSASSGWNILNQDEGVVSRPDGGKTNAWLDFYDKYTTMDLTLNLKDKSEGSEETRTTVKFEFDNATDDKKADTVYFSVVSQDGALKFQTTPGTIHTKYTTHATWTGAEKELYESEEGIDFRIVRNGTKFIIYMQDGTDSDLTNRIQEFDLSQYIEADTKATVSIQREGAAGTEVTIPFNVADTLPEYVQIIAKDQSNEDLVTDCDEYVIGEVVTIAAKDGYYCKEMTVNGEAVTLEQDGTYSFAAKEKEYNIAALVAEKLFVTQTGWDLREQNGGTKDGVTTGKVTLPKGGIGGGNGWLYFDEKYTDIDLTITAKDDPNASGEPRTTIGFIFGEKAVAISLTQNTKGVVVQNYPSITNTINTGWTDYKVLEDAEVAQYKSEAGTGLKFRAVRNGTDLVIYVEDVDYAGVMEEAAYIDLSAYGISATDEATVGIRHEGESGNAKEIPFEFTTNVVATTITTSMDDTYGTFEVQNTHHFVGDKILIERTSEYVPLALKHLAGVQVDEETTVNLDADATCSFVATEEAHSVEGIYRNTIFTERSGSQWNLTQQNQGTDAKGTTSGVVSIAGETQSWLYLYETDGAARYGDVDLTFTLKDFGGTTNSWSQIKFAFKDATNTERVLLLTVAESNGKATFKQEDHKSMALGIGTICELDYDKYTGAGVDVRVKREGTEIQLYVDDVLQKSIDLSGYIENDSLARVGILHGGDKGKQVEIPYKLKYPNIIVEDSEYGTLSVDKKYCEVGDEVVIQKGELLDSSYYLAGLLINDEEVELGSDGTYTLTVAESSYVIKGIYRKKVFTDNSNWDLTKQNQGTDAAGVTSGVITYTKPSTGSASWLYLYQATSGAQEYGDVDLTLNIRNYDSSFSTSSNTQVKFETAASSGYWFRFVVQETTAGGVNVFRTGSFGNLSATPDYQFSADEVTAYNSDEGVDIRVIREGTMFYLYVGENCRVTLNLSASISSDTKSAVCILRDNDRNLATSVSYKLLLPIVRIEDSEYGTVVADKYTYNHGDEIVIQEGEIYDSSYYLAGLLINGEEVELGSDGTYTLTAKKVSYVIEGIFRKKIFTDNSNWDLTKQNQGTDEEGVTSGVITYTKPSTGSASWLYLYQATSGAKEYGDVDLTLNIRNYDSSFSTSSNTQVKFETAASSGYWFRFVVQETTAGGVNVFRTGSFGNLSATPDYQFSADEVTAYNSDEGVELRVVRKGTMFYLYVGENCRVTLNLSASISSDTKSAVCILRDNDRNLATSVPYKLSFAKEE